MSIQRGICMDKHTCMYIYIYTEYIQCIYIYIHSYLSYLSVSIYLPTVSRSDQMIISTWSIVHCILSPRAATHQAWHNMPISTLQSPLRRNDLGGSKSCVMGDLTTVVETRCVLDSRALWQSRTHMGASHRF